MRQLHVLGVSDDGQALLLGPTAGKASHRLPLDEKLRAAVRGQLSAVGVGRAEAALTPKEMQARMREGATPEEVAKEAQVPVARVLPYAAPVIAERERIVEQARGSVLHRSRGPNGQRPLGEVVDAHLGETAGLKPESVEWTARRRRDGAWTVLLSYAARGGRRSASWLWRPAERDLTALDTSASRLAAEETANPKRKTATKRAAPATKRAAGTRATKKAARRPAAKKAAKATRVTARPARKAAPPAPRPAAHRAAKTAPAKPAAKQAKKPAVRGASTTKPRRPAKTAPKKAARNKLAAVKPAPAPARRPRLPVDTDEAVVRPTVVPDPVVTETPNPVVVIRPQTQPEPDTEPEPDIEPQPIAARRPKQRMPLPSWSDVLLGVAPPETSREASARRRRKSG